mgnify:CR=1 FL=1
MKIYDFTVKNRKGEDVSLENFKGKVLLIVNTATRCGFTPQYEELENLYEKYNKEGFEVLDFPCNQFGNQAPESDDEIHTFCQLNYKVKFDQFAKVEVNGENAIPLFKYLKEQKGFTGFDPKHKLTSILNEMLSKNDPDFAKKPDIKWNFTKFLVDKSGNVVARFEPTTGAEEIEKEIKKSKIVGGLSGEAKQLVDKFRRIAKEKGQPFIDFESEGLLYVTVYDENNLVYCIPIFSFKDNKKVDFKKIEYISEDAKRMENILRNSNEKKKEIEKDY